ncbi:MAG TPA: hypothetical protein VMH87_16000 [Pseudomonadales bacterium]|nr:hypothetical protein [Pseudomonadales bacterium]
MSEDTAAFPKLLVATDFPPNIPGGGGAIVRQMLKDWPVNKIFWWSTTRDKNQFFGQNVAKHFVANIPPRLYPNKRGKILKNMFLETAWRPWAASHLRKTLETVRPDVIWAIPHGWSIPPLADALLRANVGLHFSIYDYPDNRSTIGRFGANRCRQMAKQVDELYVRATTRDVISQQMMDDLQVRMGVPGAINRAGLESEDFNYLQAEPKTQNKSIRIAYAGTIIAEETFAVFAKALAKLRGQLPLPLTLDFFGDHSYRSQPWFNADWMIEHGSLNIQELGRALKECTWGFSPMELTDDNARYNRFSLPTKVVSYLAAGLPVISLGHPESTIVKLASQYDVGICLAESNVDDLCLRLSSALSEINPRTKFQPGILRCASAEFDARSIRKTLYENFQKCASAFR